MACWTRVTAGKPLTGIRPVTTRVPGQPADVVASPDGRWEFAALTGDSGGAVAVLALGHGAPRLVRTVVLPENMKMAFGMALTHDGRLLLVATYTATVVMSVPALEGGAGHTAAGVLSDAGTGQFSVAVSGDDRYAYVADETSGGLSVFNLGLALRNGFEASGVAVGMVPLVPSADGQQVGAVGVTVSPDGSLVYVTTLGGHGPAGRLWMIDARRADSGAGSRAVLAHAAAGCGPVRVSLSPDGGTAWVTAQLSNALLAFSTAGLRRDPASALRAVVPVGSEPTGLVLAGAGRAALVTNSSRFLALGDTPQTVSVIGTAAALAHRPALAGSVTVGAFPRNLALDPATGDVLVANYGSATLEEFPAPRA